MKLSWVDFSASENRTMLDVIRLFREEGTLDELGIGSIRDAFSDLMFPGITTIQTRARYFLLVPWLFRWREGVDRAAHRGSAGAEDRYRSDEVGMVPRLLQGSEEAGVDPVGIIGRDAGAHLIRLPSEVYWGGMGRWGIRRTTLSKSEYFRQLDDYHRRQASSRSAVEDELAGTVPETSFDPGLPDPPPGFPRHPLTLVLTQPEARYLRDRVLTHCGESLLAMLMDGQWRPGVEADVESPWEWLRFDDLAPLTPTIRDTLNHARRFALYMNVAARLYNVMLSQAIGNLDREAHHAAALEVGLDRIRDGDDLRPWKWNQFWATVDGGDELAPSPRRATRGTRSFVEAWVDLVLRSGARPSLVHDPHARELLAAREISTKGRRARLHNPGRLKTWGGDSGTTLLDYRWRVARTVLEDIRAGLALQTTPA